MGCLVLWVVLAFFLVGQGVFTFRSIFVALLVLALGTLAWDVTRGLVPPNRLVLGAFLSLSGPFLWLSYSVTDGIVRFYGSDSRRVCTLADLQSSEAVAPHLLLKGPVVFLYPLARPCAEGVECPVIARDSPVYEQCRRGQFPARDSFKVFLRCPDPGLGKLCLVRNEVVLRSYYMRDFLPRHLTLVEEEPYQPDSIYSRSNLPCFAMWLLVQGIGTALLVGTILKPD